MGFAEDVFGFLMKSATVSLASDRAFFGAQMAQDTPSFLQP